MKHYSPTGRRNHGRPLKRLVNTWDRNGSTSGPTPWHMSVATKSKRLTDHRNTLTYVLIVKRPLKFFRLVKLWPHWYDSAKGHWMLFSLFSKTHQGVRTFWWKWKWNRRWALGRVLLTNLQDQSQPLGSRVGTLGRRSTAGYLTSRWRCSSLTGNQRQARELILGPSLATKTRLLSPNRTQQMVIKRLLNRHNTTGHLYMKRLTGIPWWRKCGVVEEISAHVLWRPHLDIIWVSSFWTLRMLEIWACEHTGNFIKGTGLPKLGF